MVVIDRKVCEDNGLSLSEFLMMLIVNENVAYTEVLRDCIDKGYVTVKFDKDGNRDGYRVTSSAQSTILSVIANSNVNPSEDDKVKRIARCLKDVYPKGKKDGTQFYWAEGLALIEKRLKLFFKKYPEYKQYDTSVFVDAAKRYIESFNGNYSYMKLLKYFIFKEKVNAGDVESTSELINYIDNANQEDEKTSDWTDELK